MHSQKKYNIVQITLCHIMTFSAFLANLSCSNVTFHTLSLPSVNVFEGTTVSFQSPILKSDN